MSQSRSVVKASRISATAATKRKTRGLIITGMVFAIVLAMAVAVPAMYKAREQAKEAVCQSNLKQIGMAMALYGNSYSDVMPPNFDFLIMDGQYPKMFYCPSDAKAVNGPSEPKDFQETIKGSSSINKLQYWPIGDPRWRSFEEKVSYFYLQPAIDADGATFIVCDFAGNHPDGSRNVLQAGGSVVSFKDDATFQEALKLPENAAFAAALEKAEKERAAKPTPTSSKKP